MKTTTLPIEKSMNCSPLRRGFIFVAIACFALLPSARAVSPPPDGGYPGANTAEGQNALFSLTTGTDNTALGFDALLHNTTGNTNTAVGLNALFFNNGSQNVAVGGQALQSNTTGFHNTADGFQALFSNTTGNHNTADGDSALVRNTTGIDNTANGAHALHSNTTGSSNIALGFNAGDNLTIGNNNIDIGNVGIAAESHTIRIGTQGTQIRTFVAGIRGVMTGNANAVLVMIDSAGQLGTMSSSRRFKKEIKPMDQTSEAILSLQPVTFQYKSDPTGTAQFGLIAEEVAQVDPNLVVRDAKGEIYSVRYEAVNAMLLNEFLKEHRKAEQQERKAHEQDRTIAQLKKGMEVLTAQLQEQASQIQKVNAQMEVNRPTPQVVLNNP